jgi:hypothetical protein
MIAFLPDHKSDLAIFGHGSADDEACREERVLVFRLDDVMIVPVATHDFLQQIAYGLIHNFSPFDGCREPRVSEIRKCAPERKLRAPIANKARHLQLSSP